jgi:hypothetical protein
MLFLYLQNQTQSVKTLTKLGQKILLLNKEIDMSLHSMEVQAVRNHVMEMCACPAVRRKKNLKMILDDMKKILHQCTLDKRRAARPGFK